ncbi:MBL fold metallo-hydrolase [Pseudonocardia asaccharolytica]|uniref:Zn-dependent hydrolase n=1 Tax=Pseudonocardia asaccharolytica DSM 44247 = NBRC 16224 TaxID=1123024 RepID=A0A511D245_9PSEU|nr:MBL fold metallo-hydrolase [Pseudonocardia asaccharolytica]GEL18852.1 Zn-dependent hydrolase [Pseudonocardia asaccharolytica DSM 44247 = NBRC 16224]
MTTVTSDPVAGLTRVALPVGVNAVESVNMHVLTDGDRVTIVDCGVWRPDLPDGGLDAVEAGLERAGYALRDVSRIVVTHAHIDHYGLAGRLMELTGAELQMHTMTDLDCEKYRHPDTARARRRDTYADHGVSETERTDLADHLTRWMPYLHTVVEASRRLRGGEQLAIGADRWEVVHTPGHSLGHVCLWSQARRVLLSGDHLLPSITPPVTFERGFDADPLRSYLDSLRRVAERGPEHVYPGHGRPFGDAVGRIEAILRNKIRRLEKIRRAIQERPSSVTELADRLVAKAILAHQRQLALNETLAHIAYLRWSGLVERRARPDGVYEWYSTSDAPLDVHGRLAAS